MDHSLIRLRSLPFQIIRFGTSVILKRGCTEIRFQGAHYADRLALFLELSRSSSTEQDILARIEERDRPETLAMLRLLQAKQIVIPTSAGESGSPVPETPLDIFNWHFRPQDQHSMPKPQSRHIVLLGDNRLARDLSETLALSGFRHVTAVEDPLRGDPRTRGRSEPEPIHSPTKWRPIPYETWIQQIDWKNVDCLVATSDAGGRDLLREWNELAIHHHCHFLPVVLQDVIGFIGPLVVPGETACYECLIARENSHLDDPGVRRAIERAAPEGRHVVGYHPLMISVLSGVAAFELVKLYGEMVAALNVGTLIEVNLLGTRMTTRKVLRIPRCRVCSSLLEQPSISIHKPNTTSKAPGI